MIELLRVAVLAVVLGIPCSVLADDTAREITYQLETSIASSYISRGIPQYTSRSSPSSQSSAALQIDHVHGGALSFGVWNAVAMDDFGDQPGTAVQLDLSLAYAYQTGALKLTTGYLTSLFPEHADDCAFDGVHEVSAIVAYETPYLVPSAAAYVEVVHQQGVYLTVGATRDLRHSDWTFSPAVSLGGATYRKYAGGERSAAPHFNDVTAAVSARRDLRGGLYASAKLSYSLFGTPADLLAMEADTGLTDRSSLLGVVAFGVAR